MNQFDLFVLGLNAAVIQAIMLILRSLLYDFCFSFLTLFCLLEDVRGKKTWLAVLYKEIDTEQVLQHFTKLVQKYGRGALVYKWQNITWNIYVF